MNSFRWGMCFSRGRDIAEVRKINKDENWMDGLFS